MSNPFRLRRHGRAISSYFLPDVARSFLACQQLLRPLLLCGITHQSRPPGVCYKSPVPLPASFRPYWASRSAPQKESVCMAGFFYFFFLFLYCAIVPRVLACLALCSWYIMQCVLLATGAGKVVITPKTRKRRITVATWLRSLIPEELAIPVSSGLLRILLCKKLRRQRDYPTSHPPKSENRVHAWPIASWLPTKEPGLG